MDLVFVIFAAGKGVNNYHLLYNLLVSVLALERDNAYESYGDFCFS